MARVLIQEGQWEAARKELKARGITLTRRRTSNGEYVCYADKKLRAKMSEMIYNFERNKV